MLNELHALAQSLAKLGVKPDSWHQSYTPIPKSSKANPCYRLFLSNDGQISKIEIIGEELSKRLRKYGDNNGTFPAFNTVPLYRIIDNESDDKKKFLGKLISGQEVPNIVELKRWCVSDSWALKKVKVKLERCLNVKAKALGKRINAQKEPDNQVTQLIDISLTCFSGANGISDFRKALEVYIFSKLEAGEDVSICLQILFHFGDARKKHDEDLGSIAVFLDIFDWEQYGHAVAIEGTTKWINDVLQKADKADATTQYSFSLDDRLDAFGASYVDVDESMPHVKLPGIDVVLRAMFHEQKSQYRYGKIDDKSYPITKDNRAMAAAALGWIADERNKGKTWCREENGIIFVYPSTLPKILPMFASILAPQQDAGILTERFSDVAQKVTNSLQGLLSSEKPKNIHVFSIKKMDKARSKVVFNRNYSPEWFVEAAEVWQAGCANIPTIDIRTFPPHRSGTDSNESNKPGLLSSQMPFPLQVPKIVNDVWNLKGEKTAVERMKYYDGMNLLLDLPSMSNITNLMHILMANSCGLVQFISNEQHFGRVNSYFHSQATGSILRVVGLLLYKCNYIKEKYMNDTAYLVGQILKISDELHAFYCKVVRDNEVPPQLAGNSVFVSATEAPGQALAQLCLRMNPYIAWAKQYQTKCIIDKDKESWRAGWFLRLYENAMDRMRLLLSKETRFGVFEKAQVFIGYLASFPQKEKNNTDKVEGEQTNEQ